MSAGRWGRDASETEGAVTRGRGRGRLTRGPIGRCGRVRRAGWAERLSELDAGGERSWAGGWAAATGKLGRGKEGERGGLLA